MTKPDEPIQTKVFDVARPGKVPVSATSRPVIVGHKPQVQDPMVSQEQTDEPRSLLNSKTKVTVRPSAVQTPPAEVSATPPPAEDVAGSSVTAQPQLAPESLPEQTAATVPPSSPSVEPLSAEVPTPPGPVAPQPVSTAAEAPEPDSVAAIMAQGDPDDASAVPHAVSGNERHGAGMPVLSSNETPAAGNVVVSHHQGSSRAGQITVIIIVLLLIGLAVFDILLDAGFVTLKNIPSTDFF